MHYILSEEEYKALVAKGAAAEIREKDKIQALCTMVADYKPVGMGRNSEPWGCTINVDDGVCDGCPVEELCGYEFKEWSQ